MLAGGVLARERIVQRDLVDLPARQQELAEQHRRLVGVRTEDTRSAHRELEAVLPGGYRHHAGFPGGRDPRQQIPERHRIERSHQAHGTALQSPI